MYEIAFIYGDIPIYWESVILFLAGLTGIVLFLAACLRKGEGFAGAAVACPISIMLSLILSRLAHWYFRPDYYGSFSAAMSDFFGPGHALMGAFAGCALTACLLWLMGTIDSLPAMLDAMSFGGCAAIALGRLGSFFTPDDRGMILAELGPWTFPAMNPTSGVLEYRFATFLAQSLTAACIFAVLLVLLFGRGRKAARKDGDVTLLFLLMYCAGQILWDSTRYDALRLRHNGFISAVQLLCALVLAGVLVILSVRAGRVSKTGLLLRWLAIGLALGGAGLMEYYAQIRGDWAGIAYTVMGICLMVIVVLGAGMCRQVPKKTAAENTSAEKEVNRKYSDGQPLGGILTGAAAAGLLLLSVVLLLAMMLSGGQSSPRGDSRLGAVEQFFDKGTAALAEAVPGFEMAQGAKHYRIAGDAAAPRPNRDCFGKAEEPGQMADVIARAETLLDGQSLYFSTDMDILEDFGILYYLDETILTITWKQAIDGTVYTFSEVKVADPSQFRRYLVGGTYGSGKLVYPTEMAGTVNSVVASSGDYFEFRNAGVIVYNGEVCRVGGGADTCYIDSSGDLSFTYVKDHMNKEKAAEYVADKDIQFSLAFGPVLVEDGELHQFGGYGLGEVDGIFSRAALCQMDELHYLVINACAEGDYHRNLTMYEFARQVHKTGCRMAYALDGGQTAAHMVNGVLVNEVTRGYQRKISDIIYFATAVPNK